MKLQFCLLLLMGMELCHIHGKTTALAIVYKSTPATYHKLSVVCTAINMQAYVLTTCRSPASLLICKVVTQTTLLFHRHSVQV